MEPERKPSLSAASAIGSLVSSGPESVSANSESSRSAWKTTMRAGVSASRPVTMLLMLSREPSAGTCPTSVGSKNGRLSRACRPTACTRCATRLCSRDGSTTRAEMASARPATASTRMPSQTASLRNGKRMADGDGTDAYST
jgi:hypothetical protein